MSVDFLAAIAVVLLPVVCVSAWLETKHQARLDRAAEWFSQLQ
jgi:hypothetical protein